MKFLITEPEIELLVGTSKKSKKDDKAVSDFIKKEKAILLQKKQKNNMSGIVTKVPNTKSTFAKKNKYFFLEMSLQC